MENKSSKNRRLGILFLAGPLLGLFIVLALYAVTSFISSSLVEENVNTYSETNTINSDELLEVDLTTTILNLFRVILGFFGIIFVFVMIPGVIMGVYFMSKSQSEVTNAEGFKSSNDKIDEK